MSDNIKDLPIDQYSNPNVDEIKIMNNLFDDNNEKFNFKHIKLYIIICFLHIIFYLLQLKYKTKIQYFLISSSIAFFIAFFLSINYII
jgi:hypothetical protein